MRSKTAQAVTLLLTTLSLVIAGLFASPPPASAMSIAAGCVTPTNNFEIHSSSSGVYIAWTRLTFKVCWGSGGHLTSVSSRSETHGVTSLGAPLWSIDMYDPYSVGGFTSGQDGDTVKVNGEMRACYVRDIALCDPTDTLYVQAKIIAPYARVGPGYTTPQIIWSAGCNNSWCGANLRIVP